MSTDPRDHDVPPGMTVREVDATNPFMVLAYQRVTLRCFDPKMQKSAALVVKGGIIMGIGENYSDIHRVQKEFEPDSSTGCHPGEDGKPCKGCRPEEHGEYKALIDSKKKGLGTACAELYVWGKYELCPFCWDAIAKAGIRKVVFLENSKVLFGEETADVILEHLSLN